VKQQTEKGTDANQRLTTARRRPELVHEGNLIYLNASSKLICQLDEARRQLDRLERHANRILRSVGAY
jgi:hypothetical protein